MFLAQAAEQSTLLNIIVPLIPWLLIFGFVWFTVFRSLRSDRARARQSHERALAHWDAVEAKLDRVIQLLENRGSHKQSGMVEEHRTNAVPL